MFGWFLQLFSNGFLFFILHLSQPAGVDGVGVAYATADGTATAGSDYVATSGTIMFAEGEDTASVAVSLLDDAIARRASPSLVELRASTLPSAPTISCP